MRATTRFSGAAVVDALERLSVFAIFRSPWFSAALVVLVLSIVVCTLDRTPRLWRGVRDVRVAQPEPFFDPRLPDRAAMDGVPAESIRTVLRKNGFHVREATDAAGTRLLYGDRHQYTKLATLFTHLGLILFLVAAAVTSRLGEEQGLVVGEGETLTVQPIGTPGLLLVRNLAFQAPGLDTGQPTDFTTDLAVFQDGRQIARKTIRVNDPLSIAGYTFHQNGFGPAPAPRRPRRPAAGRCGTATVPTDRLPSTACPTASSASPAATSASRCCSTAADGGTASLLMSALPGHRDERRTAARYGRTSEPIALHIGETGDGQ